MTAELRDLVVPHSQGLSTRAQDYNGYMPRKYSPLLLLQSAYEEVRSVGSCTATLVILRYDYLRSINLGDSGLMILRFADGCALCPVSGLTAGGCGAERRGRGRSGGRLEGVGSDILERPYTVGGGGGTPDGPPSPKKGLVDAPPPKSYRD